MEKRIMDIDDDDFLFDRMDALEGLDVDARSKRNEFRAISPSALSLYPQNLFDIRRIGGREIVPAHLPISMLFRGHAEADRFFPYFALI
jgi:hypothetical protein